MNDYLHRVWLHIQPYSIADNVYDALKEWYRIEGAYRYERNLFQNCQLCGHEDIKHIHPIRNRHTQVPLDVGSQCILQFAEASNEQGAGIDIENLKQAMAKDEREFKEMESQEQLHSYLKALRLVDPEFPVDITDDRGMSPRQLIWARKRLDRAGIEYDPRLLKVRLRKQHFYNQMFHTERRADVIRYVFDCMSTAQLRAFDFRRFDMEAPPVYRKPTNRVQEL